MEALLRRCSWHAEKLFRRRGRFDSVLWLTEGADGQREMFETECRAPDGPSDEQILRTLADEMGEEFAASGVTAFAVAYLVRHVTKIQPIDPPLPESTTQVTMCVMIEAHSTGQHIRCEREIVSFPGFKVLAAASRPQPAGDSLYASVRQEVESV